MYTNNIINYLQIMAIICSLFVCIYHIKKHKKNTTRPLLNSTNTIIPIEGEIVENINTNSINIISENNDDELPSYSELFNKQ